MNLRMHSRLRWRFSFLALRRDAATVTSREEMEMEMGRRGEVTGEGVPRTATEKAATESMGRAETEQARTTGGTKKNMVIDQMEGQMGEWGEEEREEGVLPKQEPQCFKSGHGHASKTMACKNLRKRVLLGFNRGWAEHPRKEE